MKTLCIRLAKELASDGEGAKHLITCNVSGAKDDAGAETIGKAVISSTLMKAAVFGADANWGGFFAPWDIPVPSLIRKR